MSMRLDRKDLDRLYDENMKAMLSSSVIKMWERQAASGDAPVVAIFPMRNETSEHIGDSSTLCSRSSRRTWSTRLRRTWSATKTSPS